MGNTGEWTVGELARLARVSVRTLHHYDEIGLLTPTARSDAGYRLYSRADLDRLHAILLHRALGFALDRIPGMLAAPIDERRAALSRRREELHTERNRTDAMIGAVERALAALDGRNAMTEREMRDDFLAFANAPADVRAHQAEHQPEARERWGDTDAYGESMRRARGYSAADW